MGVTIHYRGTLRDPRRIDAFCAEVRALIKPWGWEARSCEITSRRVRITAHAGGANEGRAVAGRILSTFNARGLVLFPHFASEPIPLLVETHCGLLVDVEAPGSGDSIEPGSSVKTQFAPVDVHKQVCKLFYEIRERLIPDLDVDDESDYFRNGDVEILGIARRQVDRELAQKAQEAAARGAAWRVGYHVPRGEGYWRILDFVVGSEKDPRFQLNNTVPDRIEPGIFVYEKHEPKLFMTDQIRLVIEACEAHGKRFRIVTPRSTELSHALRAALEGTDRFAGHEETDRTEDAGLYLCLLDEDLEIDYGGIEVGSWKQFQKYRDAIHLRIEKRFLRKTPVGERFPLFLTRMSGGWRAEELAELKEELEEILVKASSKAADPSIVPEYASRVRSRFRALHHCFVDTQVEPLLEKLIALCNLGIEKKLPMVMQ